jgi:nitrite reductase (NO-forming)
MGVMVVGLVLVAVALGLVVGGWGRTAGRSSASARRILDERLARRDISPNEYRQTRAALDESRRARPGRWLPAALAVAGIGLVVTPWAFVDAGVAAPGSAGWPSSHAAMMVGHMGWGRSGTTTESRPAADATEVTVEAGDLWFRPDTIDLTAGTTTNVTVHNTGAVFHDLTIPALGVKIEAEPGGSATLAVTPDTPGTYEFFCSVPGHSAAGMRGDVVVHEKETP